MKSKRANKFGNRKTASINSYKVPLAAKLSTREINKASGCACSAGSDNPY